MVTKFKPDLDRVYFIKQYSLFHILSGSGNIEVDFRSYFDWQDKIFYLSKGQYIKFMSNDFEVRKIEFPDRQIFGNKDFRVLFKHLISLGYINFKDCAECEKYLSETVFISGCEIVDISSQQWYWKNPFNAERQEYHLIFDVKEIIDREYQNHLTNRDLSELLREQGHFAQALVREKVGVSAQKLMANKRLLESKRMAAFTDQSVKEIAYELGYKDPAYFNRQFSKETGKSPLQFREDFDFSNRDQFEQNLLELLKTNHTHHRSLQFYADKMHMSVRTLSRKVKDRMNVTLGQLIRQELINTAKTMLSEDCGIKETAWRLGFEEPNHFSSFFKYYTGFTPTELKRKKYNP